MNADLTVELPGGREVPVGVIEEIGSPGRSTIEFRYAPTYLTDPDAYALSPDLPLGPGRFTPRGTRAMFGGIADAQPDLWGRRLIDAGRRRNAKAHSARFTRPTELDVLCAVPDLTRQGAIRVVKDGEHIARGLSTPTLVDLPDLIAMARAFEDGEEIPDEFRRLVNAGSSMGGDRPKATVRLPDGTLAIAKLPREDDFGDAMAWEATALELARRSGVHVPQFTHHRTGFQSVLVVARFDRDGDRRVGYLSADSLLMKQPGEVYDYTDLVEAISPLSGAARTDTHELFRRIAVTLLINNVDDHLKNHGLIRKATGWRLSPVFDINPFYRSGSVESTPLTREDDPRDRDIRNLVDAAESFSLSPANAIAIIRKVEMETSDWRNVAGEFGIEPEGADAMAAAFENPNRDIAIGLRPPRSEPARLVLGEQPRTSTGRFDSKRQSPPENFLD